MSVELKVNETGNNETETECSFTKTNVLKIDSVTFMAFNKTSRNFEAIAAYIPDTTTLLNPKGMYLKGRVTLMNITQSSTKAVLIFNELLCIDDTLYTCSVRYTDSRGDGKETVSNNISILFRGTNIFTM